MATFNNPTRNTSAEVNTPTGGSAITWDSSNPQTWDSSPQATWNNPNFNYTDPTRNTSTVTNPTKN